MAFQLVRLSLVLSGLLGFSVQAYQEVASSEPQSVTSGTSSYREACMDLDQNYAKKIGTTEENFQLAQRCSQDRDACKISGRFLASQGKEIPKTILECNNAGVQVAELFNVKVVYPGGNTKDYGTMNGDLANSVKSYYKSLGGSHSVMILPSQP